jgi:hypothetical protein
MLQTVKNILSKKIKPSALYGWNMQSVSTHKKNNPTPCNCSESTHVEQLCIRCRRRRREQNPLFELTQISSYTL